MSHVSTCRCGHAASGHKWAAAECGLSLCPCNKYEPRPCVVIEFEAMDDYNEFMAEHHARRCSDLPDWNTYRIVSGGPRDVDR